MVWGFIWRFALFGALIGPALTRLAGFLVGLGGGGYEDARTAGFFAVALAVLLAGYAAWEQARKLRVR